MSSNVKPACNEFPYIVAVQGWWYSKDNTLRKRMLQRCGLSTDTEISAVRNFVHSSIISFFIYLFILFLLILLYGFKSDDQF